LLKGGGKKYILSQMDRKRYNLIQRTTQTETCHGRRRGKVIKCAQEKRVKSLVRGGAPLMEGRQTNHAKKEGKGESRYWRKEGGNQLRRGGREWLGHIFCQEAGKKSITPCQWIHHITKGHDPFKSTVREKRRHLRTHEREKNTLICKERSLYARKQVLRGKRKSYQVKGRGGYISPWREHSTLSQIGVEVKRPRKGKTPP